MNDRIGQQLGSYRLTRLLGRGGFAEVYLGEHVYLQKYAAIKVLSTHLDPENTSSFLAEARTLARLDHPHIVRLLDFGIENATPFLVMDYAVNGTLRLRHPKGARVPLDTVVSYVNQVANALQYAHSENIIHRDIKPANMLLGRFNEILLADFGIAIILHTSRYLLTQDNIGTIAYMSPEQIQSHPRTASDQYSLAVVVYEWLCGELPFTGNFTEIAAKHCQTAPPPLREKIPALPPAVEQVVLTALAKEPKDRFATISAFATALAQAASLRQGSPNLVSTDNSLPPPLQPTGPSRPMPAPANRTPFSFVNSFLEQSRSALLKTPRRNAGRQVFEQVQPALQGLPKPSLPSNLKVSRRTAIIGLATAGVLGAGGLIWWSRSPHQAATGSSKLSNIGQTIRIYKKHSGPVYSISWSPDSARLASSGADVRVWNATHEEPDALSLLPGSGGKVNAVAWSPDSKYIAYSDSYKVTLLPTTLGQSSTKYQPGDIPAPGYYGGNYIDYSPYMRVEALAWSPDSTYIAGGYSDNKVRVWYLNAYSTNNTYTQGYAGGPNAVMWYPVKGNIKVAYGGNGSIQIVDKRASANNFSIPTDQKNVLSVAWSSDGMYVASGSEHGTVKVWKVSNSSSKVNSFTYSTQITYDTQIGAINAIAWSPKGLSIASGSADGSVHVWDAITGQTIYSYTEHTGGVNAVAWSPDGQYIASASDDDSVRVWHAS